jgi:hypothetical protein
MARYTLQVARYLVRQPRSRSYDDLVASTGLSVVNDDGSAHQDWAGQALNTCGIAPWAHREWPGQALRVGFCQKGDDRDIGLRYECVDVPDGGSLYWGVLLVSSPDASRTHVMNSVIEAAVALARVAQKCRVTSAMVASRPVQGTADLAAMFAGAWYGVVAAQTWALTETELAASTASGRRWLTSVNYACMGTRGQVSNYDVTYEIWAAPVPQFQTPARQCVVG